MKKFDECDRLTAWILSLGLFGLLFLYTYIGCIVAHPKP
jgi:hypothetical protein